MVKEYSQGVCQDGAVILCDGEPMTPEQIVERLTEREGKREGVLENLVKMYENCISDRRKAREVGAPAEELYIHTSRACEVVGLVSKLGLIREFVEVIEGSSVN